MFLSREIDIKLCKNYTKSYIYQILYKIRSTKQTIFNTTISHRSLSISDLLLLKFYNFYFAFSIDIIDNISTYITISMSRVSRDQFTGLPFITKGSLCKNIFSELSIFRNLKFSAPFNKRVLIGRSLLRIYK